MKSFCTISLCLTTHARITLATPCLLRHAHNFFFHQYTAKLQPMPGWGEVKVVLHPWKKWKRVWDLGVLHSIGWGPKGKSVLLKLVKCGSFLNWAVLFLHEPCCRQTPFIFLSPSHGTGGEARHNSLCETLICLQKADFYVTLLDIEDNSQRSSVFGKVELRPWGEKLWWAAPWSRDVVVL